MREASRRPVGRRWSGRRGARAAALGALVALGISACDWGDIDEIPAGFADGVDNDTQLTPGPGLTETDGVIEADFDDTDSHSGSSDLVARGDHDHDDDYVRKVGDTMTGALILDADPAADLGAATKQYVDAGRGQSVDGVTTAIGGDIDLVEGDNVTVTPDDGADTITIAVAGGSGSGLDADTLDGMDSADLMLATDDNWVDEGGDTMTGTLVLPADGLVAGANQLVLSSGRVGIGTGAPQSELDVSGTITATGLTIPTDASPSYVLTSDAAGNATWAAAAGGPAWGLLGNAGTTAGTNFLGTTDDQPVELHVNGARPLRMEPGASPNVIGGHASNTVTAGVVGATIGGGGQASGAGPNAVSADYATVTGGALNTASGGLSTVGGGSGNIASEGLSTIGGGAQNTASGGASTVGGGMENVADSQFATVGGGWQNQAGWDFATVGGGNWNIASGECSTVAGGHANDAAGEWSTVGGGWYNTASGTNSTVGGGSGNTASGGSATVAGGFSNTASGTRATVPGGRSNSAGGDYSFAAGAFAKADHAGAFVWPDFDSAVWDFHSVTENEFAVRARGGVRFVTAIDGTGAPTAGVNLAAGGTSWGTISDRNRKKGFEPVDGEAMLAEFARLDIPTWNYVWEEEGSVRHMGPMAQDFHKAFGLGSDDKVITTQEADGVALAAIKALERRTRELREENADLRKASHALERRVLAVERALALEARE